MTAMRRAAVVLFSCVLVAAGLATAGALANTATVGLDDQHRLCVTSSAAADVVVDLVATWQ
jgi:hypothetical protein